MKSWIASWHNNVYSCHAGVHWAVNNGVDEGEIAEGIKLAYERLENGKLVGYDSEYRFSGNALMVKITQEGESLDVACADMAGGVFAPTLSKRTIQLPSSMPSYAKSSPNVSL
jgi:hypothetical protein